MECSSRSLSWRSGLPLLVVLTCRPRGAGIRLPNSRALEDSAGHLMLMLNPLNAAASGSMLQSILGVKTVSPQVVDLIHERAGGNPLLPRRNHPIAHRGGRASAGERHGGPGPRG